ncbi:MAG: nucleotidyltransferase [Planctomycetota bacterium]
MTNRDFKDLLAALCAHDVRFLIVGGYAVTFHARPRFTKDLDIWIDPTADNGEKVFSALASFGAPLQSHGVTPRDFAVPGTIYQMGLPPSRVDILTAVDGLQFQPCWERRVGAHYGGVAVAYLSRDDLITNKKKVARPQDLEDVRALERDR